MFTPLGEGSDPRRVGPQGRDHADLRRSVGARPEVAVAFGRFTGCHPYSPYRCAISWARQKIGSGRPLRPEDRASSTAAAVALAGSGSVESAAPILISSTLHGKEDPAESAWGASTLC